MNSRWLGRVLRAKSHPMGNSHCIDNLKMAMRNGREADLTLSLQVCQHNVQICRDNCNKLLVIQIFQKAVEVPLVNTVYDDRMIIFESFK